MAGEVNVEDEMAKLVKDFRPQGVVSAARGLPRAPAPSVREILEERGKTHGDYRVHAEVAQTLKEVFFRTRGREKLNAAQAEAVDMILHKLGRIAAGNPNHQDHWNDIAGYATLAADRCA